MPTAPTPITPYATPPNSNDSANFDARADAKVADDVAKVAEYNALAVNVYDNASEAFSSAATAVAKAAAAAASEVICANYAQTAASSSGAALWVSGATYAVGAVVWAPSDGRVYRRRPGTAGAGTIDPSADSTNWSPVSANGLQLAFVSATSATVTANTDTAFTNAAACAATVPAIAVGEAFVVRFDNGRRDNTVDLGGRSMVGPNGVICGGVITLNVQPLLSLRWWGDYYRSY